MNTRREKLLLVIFIISAIPLYSRDINLDGIYLSEKSPVLTAILEKKLEVYQAVQSQFVDRNVIYAAWLNGFDIVYIKETSGINIIAQYNRTTMTTRELARIPGIITGARRSLDGKFLYIKKLTHAGEIPAGETIILNIPLRKKQSIATVSPFIDFTLSPSGTSILIEEREGIVELTPEFNSRRLIIRRDRFKDFTSGNPTLAYQSPNRRSTLLINGSGGSYRALILSSGTMIPLKGLTSSTEVFWIDNQRLIFRRGSVGQFTAVLLDISTGKEKIISRQSLNTNIGYSPFPKIIAFLNDQMIHYYEQRSGATVCTGLEGEDVDFSPDGIRFTSLYLNRLFITNINNLKRYNDLTKKTAGEIHSLYIKMQSSPELFVNEYSASYISRKIILYRQFREN